MKPRVILADDHMMVAEGLGHLITRDADLVDQVFDGGQLVESARRHRPDIIVSDITMPVMSGLDAMRKLQSENIRARFIFLTIHSEPRLAAEAIRSGAQGYVLKQAAGEELMEAIRTVMAGQTYLTPLITGDVLWSLANTGGSVGDLTPRQIEVLRLIALGKRMKEIAGELGLSVRTVEDHKSHLLETLGAETTADLIRFAIKKGLVSG